MGQSLLRVGSRCQDQKRRCSSGIAGPPHWSMAEAEPPLDVDPSSTDLTGDERSFPEVEDTARREVLDGGLRPDLDRLVRQSDRERDVERRASVDLARDVDRAAEAMKPQRPISLVSRWCWTTPWSTCAP